MLLEEFGEIGGALKTSLEATKGCALDWDVRTGVLRASPSFGAALGLTPEHEPKSTDELEQIIHPDDRPDFERQCRPLLEGRSTILDHEFRILGPEGIPLWFLARCAVIEREAGGRAVRIVGLLQDITARKAVQRAREESEARYRELLSFSSEAISRMEFAAPIDLNQPSEQVIAKIFSTGFVAESNDAHSRLFGLDRPSTEVIGKRLSDIVSKDRPDIQKITRDFAESGFRSTEGEVEGVDALGNARFFSLVLIGIVEDNALRRIWRIGRDITDKKASERALLESNERLRKLLTDTQESAGILGASPAIRRVVEQIEMVAQTDSTVLILGETGTGKELVASAVHARSRRSSMPLVRVNCAALVPTLIETELFGHEKGAFSGAVAARVGRFELADGGTILLDEIGDLPLELQSRLLRVLQEGEFERVGGSRSQRVDVRVIAATNRNLETAVKEGRFRQDLYFRLKVFTIAAPPLRDHREDIPLLAMRFVEEEAIRLGKPLEGLTPQALVHLKEHSWPGNVRELRHTIEREAIMTAAGESVDVPRLRDAGSAPQADRPLTLADAERKHIRKALESTNWVIGGPAGAAAVLGTPPSTLRYRIQKLGLTRS